MLPIVRVLRAFPVALCLVWADSLSASVAMPQGERVPESFQVAVGLQQRGLHEEAARQFGDFLSAHEDHELSPEAHYRRAVSLIELQRSKAAIGSLRLALTGGGDDFALRPECRYRLGNLLQAADRHDEAASQFAALVGEVAEDHYLLAAAAFAGGECQRELGQDDAAVVAFTRAAHAATEEQQSFRFPAFYQLGFCQLRREALAEAVAAFEAAEKAAPDDAALGETRFLQGDTLLRLRRHDDAERALRAALEVDSEFGDDAAYGLGWVALGRGDRQAARAAFDRVLREFGKSPLADKARLEIGRALYQDQKYEESEKVLAPLIGDDVADDVRRQARELCGLCALASGAGEAAVASLQQSLGEAADADRARLSFALAEALANLARWEEALAAYEAVPAEAGAGLHGEACYGACYALHQLGRHEDSMAKARLVLAIEPPHRLADDSAFAVAENLFVMGRYAAADAIYGELANSDRFAAKATWKRAWCDYLLGEKGRAAGRFAALADGESAHAEEALSMTSLSRLESGDADGALQAADRYSARYRDGAFLDRTERVAARVLRQRGDFAAARKRLQRAASASGREDEIRVDRIEEAEVAYQQGDFAAADELFAGLVDDAGPIGARALAGRAWCAFELGDDEACADHLARGLDHPGLGEEAVGLLELQSALAHRQQDWAVAQAASTSFLERFGEHDKASSMRYALGVAQARAGRHAAARETLSALEQVGGHDRMDRVAYELAWACRRDGDEAAALEAFERCAAASQDEELTGESRLHLGIAVLERDGVDAARPLLLAVQGSHQGRALYRLGFAEFEAAGEDVDKLRLARERFDAIAGSVDEPLTGEALYFGAECSQRCGDMDGAVERAGRLLEIAPGHERCDRARLLLGECAVQSGDGDLAVPALEQFLRAEDRERSETARAWLALGRARLLRGQHERAEAALQRVTELSEGARAAEAQYRIGETRQQAGNLRGAAEAYVKLPILYGHAEWVRKGLLQAGLVYEELGQPEKANRFFRELLSKHAGTAEAAVAKERLRDG